jgi:hypothetical protein
MTDSARLAAAKERDRANAENEAVQAWSIAAVARAAMCSLNKIVPGFLQSGAFATPVASVLARLHWFRCLTPIERMVNKVFAQASGALLAKVDSAWRQMHETFLHLNAPGLDLSKRCKMKICWYARVCICERDDLRQFVRALVSKLKKLCPKDSYLRRLLDQNLFVVAVLTARFLNIKGN